jgi:hypothetical protein
MYGQDVYSHDSSITSLLFQNTVNLVEDEARYSKAHVQRNEIIPSENHLTSEFSTGTVQCCDTVTQTNQRCCGRSLLHR